jgi:hypothetical protein
MRAGDLPAGERGQTHLALFGPPFGPIPDKGADGEASLSTGRFPVEYAVIVGIDCLKLSG